MQTVCLRVLCSITLLSGCTPGTYSFNVGLSPNTLPLIANPQLATSPIDASPFAELPENPSTEPGRKTEPAPMSSTPPVVEVGTDNVAAYQQLGEGSRLAQTFKVLRDGKLASISILLKDPPEHSPKIQIASLHGERPSADRPVAQGILKNSPEGWLTADFEPALGVKARERLAFVLTLEEPFSVYAATGPDRGYLDGTAFVGLSDGSRFWNPLGQDLVFRARME